MNLDAKTTTDTKRALHFNCPQPKNKNKKRKRLGQPRQALEVCPVKSFFDFIGRTEATRGARRWSWIKQIRLELSTPEKFYNFLNN